jgi:hypothetical protein
MQDSLIDLKRTNLPDGQRLGAFPDAVYQRCSELIEADLETISRPGFHPVGERQRGGAEVMHVDIARPQKLRVLEVVEFLFPASSLLQRFQVGQAVAHVVFAAEKFLLPDRFTLALDAAGADQMPGQITDP